MYTCTSTHLLRCLTLLLFLLCLASGAIAAPAISIDPPSASITNVGPVTFRVNYTDATAVTLAKANVTLNRTGTANGTVSVTGSSLAYRTVTIKSITGEGALGITIAPGTASNADGNAPGAGPSATFAVDSTPTISIAAPSASLTRGGPITYAITYTGANAVTLSPSDITVNSTGTATGIVSVSGTDNLSRIVTISDITGDGTLGISIAAATAVATSGKAAPAAGPSSTFTVDNTPPTVSIGPPSKDITNTGQVTYTVTYSGADQVSLSAASLAVNKTGTADGIVTVTGTGLTTRTIKISSPTGDGTISVSIPAGTASDDAGNTALAATGAAFIVDNTPPVVTISPPSAQITSSATLTYALSFTDANAVTVAGKVTLNTTGTATATVTTTGTGLLTRNVNVKTITGDGTIGISVAAGAITDAAGNASLAVGPSDTFVVDNTPPAVSISAPSALATRTGPVTYTISYTGADSVNLAKADVSLIKTGTAKGTVSVSGDGTDTRLVTISAISGDGTIAITLDPNTASDLAGNGAPAVGPSDTFAVDNTKPGISISAPSASTTAAGPITYTISYTGADSITLSAADITLNSTGTAEGSITVQDGESPDTRVVTISGITGDGTLGISLKAGTAADAIGNTADAAGPSDTFAVDNPPTISIGPPSKLLVSGEAVTYTVTYSDASAITLSPADVVLNSTGTAGGTVTVTGTNSTTRTVHVSTTTGDGTLGISIAAGTATDATGNLAAAAGPSATFAVDNTKPNAFVPVAIPSSWTSSPTVEVDFATTDNGSGIGYYQASIDSGIYSTMDSPAILDVSAVPDGVHIVHVKAFDIAGNSIAERVNIYLDKNPPSVPGTPTDAGVATVNPSLVFNWTASTDAGTGVAYYNCRIGTTPGGNDVFEGTVGLNLTSTATGTSGKTYYCQVQAVDGMGFASAWSSPSDGIKVVSDPSPIPGVASSPASSLTSPIAVTYSGASGVVSPLKTVHLWYKKNSSGTWADSGLSSTGTSGSFSFPVTESATYYFGLVAEDEAGNTSAQPTSDGDTHTTYTAPIQTTVVQVKALADESDIVLSGPMVTRSFGSCFYIEDASRVTGIRVNRIAGDSVSEGATPVISGKVRTINGERVIDDATVAANGSGSVPSPFMMFGKFAKIAQGLLIRVGGKAAVAADATDTFTLSDGSANGVRVQLHGVSLPSDGAYVVVTGVLGADANGVLLQVSNSTDVR